MDFEELKKLWEYMGANDIQVNHNRELVKAFRELDFEQKRELNELYHNARQQKDIEKTDFSTFVNMKNKQGT